MKTCTLIPVLFIAVSFTSFVVDFRQVLGQEPNQRERSSRDDVREDRIGEILEAYHRAHLFNGVALVSESGRVIFHRAYGPANIEHGVENTIETRFRIASITKVFTAILALQLSEQGLLKLDQPIGRYVPGVRQDIATRVTLRHLLEHRSGLEREYMAENDDYNRDLTTKELVGLVNRNADWISEPGEDFHYSNTGYVLIAAVIEAVCNQPFELVLQEKILTPNGMTSTGVEKLNTTIVPDLATGYRLRSGIYIFARRIGMSWTRGNGGVYSTANDLLKLDNALRNESLLSKTNQAYMFASNDEGFGLQWQIGESYRGFPKDTGSMAWARGANPGGFRVQWTRQLDGRRTVILLANIDDSPRMEITRKIFQVLAGEEVGIPEPSLCDRALKLILAGRISTAKSLLHGSQEADTADTVNQLVACGHHLIRADRASEAIEVFVFCNSKFPGTPGIMTSLAYAHLKAGDNGKATKIAKEVLKQFPNDKDALEVLEDATAP